MRSNGTRADGPARHAYEEHIGELRLRIEAATIEGIFAEAAHALRELFVPGGLDAGARGVDETIHVEAPDLERLLAAWLDEIIFRTETEHRVFTTFQFDRLTDREVSARAFALEADSIRTIVKAATLHDLHIKQGSHGLSASVVLDV